MEQSSPEAATARSDARYTLHAVSWLIFYLGWNKFLGKRVVWFFHPLIFLFRQWKHSTKSRSFIARICVRCEYETVRLPGGSILKVRAIPPALGARYDGQYATKTDASAVRGLAYETERTTIQSVPDPGRPCPNCSGRRPGTPCTWDSHPSLSVPSPSFATLPQAPLHPRRHGKSTAAIGRLSLYVPRRSGRYTRSSRRLVRPAADRSGRSTSDIQVHSPPKDKPVTYSRLLSMENSSSRLSRIS